MAKARTRTIHLDYLARVEGEGALRARVRGQEVLDVELRIFEPPRFFEALLRGRRYTEAPDITSRICGICPIAYQTSSINAMEDAFGVKVDPGIRELRRLIYCGEWIESHGMHVYMLHAPDFFGVNNVIELAKLYPDHVRRGLELKKVGNELVSAMAGRAIHPINLKVGGFYSAPSRGELLRIGDRLKWAREAAWRTVEWVAGFEFPDFEQDYEFVSLFHESEYPIIEGRLVSSRGLDISVRDYDEHFEEMQRPYSTALHSRLKERGTYLCGPLARFNLCYDQLSAVAKEAARAAKFEPGCRNPFRSIIARSIEVLYATDEALRIIEGYEVPPRPSSPVQWREATGYGCSEAPRGTLYHRYQVDAEGIIRDAKIVPPTSQNQSRIEEDLRDFLEQRLRLKKRLKKEDLAGDCERLIRSFDPCISCSAHFLKLDLQEDPSHGS